MKLHELLDKLGDYSLQAEVAVIVHNKSEKFTLTYGDSEGVLKEDCERVSFYVDRLCQNEQAASNG